MIDIGINGGCRPCSMRLDLDASLPNEKTILRWVSTGRFYEPDVAEVFLRVLREGDTVVDVGANSGFFTMLAAALVGPQGRVVGFEADPGNCARLAGNIEANAFKHVTIVEQPALHEAGPVSFFLNSDDSGGNALWNPGEHHGNPRSAQTLRVISLQGTTVDAELARLDISGVRLVKVDTEGADHNVLRGSAKLLADGRVPFVVTELHEFGLGKMGSNQHAFRQYMAGFGYETFMLHYNGTMPRLVPRNTTIQTKVYCNMLFSTPEAVGACWPAYLHEAGPL